MRENTALLAFLATVQENVAHWVFVMNDDPERALGGIRLMANSLLIEFGSDGDLHLVPFVCEKEYRKVELRLRVGTFGDFSFEYFALPEMDETCTHERQPELHLPVVRFINVERRKAREELAAEKSRQLGERVAQDRQAEEMRLASIVSRLASKGITMKLSRGLTLLTFEDGVVLTIGSDKVNLSN
jgi:hypothetical protein